MPEAPFGGVTVPRPVKTGEEPSAPEGKDAVPECTGPEVSGGEGKIPGHKGKAGNMEQSENVIRTRFVGPYKGTLAILRRRGAYHTAGQIYLYKAGDWKPQAAREGRADCTARKGYWKEFILTISLFTNTPSLQVSVGWWSARSFHPTAHQSELISLQIPTVPPNQNPCFLM